jgi:hypothetical protein
MCFRLHLLVPSVKHRLCFCVNVFTVITVRHLYSIFSFHADSSFGLVSTNLGNSAVNTTNAKYHTDVTTVIDSSTSVVNTSTAIGSNGVTDVTTISSNVRTTVTAVITISSNAITAALLLLPAELLVLLMSLQQCYC